MSKKFLLPILPLVALACGSSAGGSSPTGGKGGSVDAASDLRNNNDGSGGGGAAGGSANQSKSDGAAGSGGTASSDSGIGSDGAVGDGSKDGSIDGGDWESTSGQLLVYEGFSATAKADMNGFQDAASVGLKGTWTVKTGAASVEARATSKGWDGAHTNTNSTFTIKSDGYFNFVENNSTLFQAQRSLADPLDLTTGPYYLSFVTSSGSGDFVGKAGLANGSTGKELMLGQGWLSGSGAHYDTSATINATTGCRGGNVSPSMADWEVVLWIAKIQKTGTSVVVTMYGYNLNGLSSPLPWNEEGATPLWSQTLTGVAEETFDKLEIEVAASEANYPSVGQIRLGTSWTKVMGIVLSSANRVWTGAGNDSNWSTGNNWEGGISPSAGDSVTFAGVTKTTATMDRSYGLRSLVFDATAGSFTIAAGGGSLSLSGGITNQSAKAQTFAVPVAFFGPQAIDVSSGDVTVAGAVSGTGGLSIVGGGTVTLSGGSSYAGATVLHDSKLVLAVSGDSTCAGAIAGNGTFVKNGAGALTLSGVNDFSGSTLVSKGAVILSNPNPQKLGSAIAVADGATFGVTALADGTALTVDSLTVGESTGGALQFSVVGASKVILDSKTMILNGTTTINISQSPRTVDVEYPLFSGFAKGSLVLGTEPPGVHGVLTVTGTTVNYKVTGRDFVHPGCLSTREDLLRMREKVRTGTEPWKSAYDVLANNSHSQSGYVAYPHPTPCRGGGCAQAGIAEDYMTMANDAAAAYQAALRYWIKEDTSFADAAIRNMDGYADKVQYLTGDSNVLLMQGAQGFQWASAAELLRDYQPWVASGGFKRFQTFLLEKFYNDPRINNGLSRFLELHNNTCASHYWLNWDLFALDAIAAIGVVCDRKDIYDEAVNYYKNGIGNGAAKHAVWFMHPGYLGQSQEMGRDSGHASADPILLGQFLEVAWNQGDDLYAYNDNTLLAMSEYTFKIMSGNDVPWVNYAGCDATSAGPASGSMYRPGAELIWNHYVNRKGLAAPYTMPWATAAGRRPEDGGGAYGNTSGGYDQIGFTTLTHARERLAVSPPPSGLKTDARESGKVLLWWWGSAYASSYSIKRSLSPNGPYTQVGTLAGDVTPLFTDSGLTAGQTYYYVVSAVVDGKETSDSESVSIAANQRLTGKVIGSDGAVTYGQWKDQLFDNAPVTFFDAAQKSGDWGGLDLGGSYVITKVGYYPRDAFAGRMVGGQFHGSNTQDFSSGVVTLFTIDGQPSSGTLTIRDITNTDGFRYVRYLGPANGSCNAAEIQFYGYPSSK